MRRDLGVHPQGEVRALSRDGRWAASSGWHSDRVRLWNADTGQMVHEWVLGKRTFVFFTPDSRALIISRGDEFSFWDVETLQPIRRLPRDVAQFPGHVAFSPDGRLMALEMAPAVIHLKEVATGRTVAKLEDPHGDRATWHGLHPRRHATGGGGQVRQGDPHLGPAGDPRAAEGDEPGLGLARVPARGDRGPGRRARDDRGPSRRPGQARPDARAERRSRPSSVTAGKSKRTRTRRRPATTWPGLI